MARKRKILPKMNCVGPQTEVFEYTNADGVSFYSYFCEGCGYSKLIPDVYDFDPNPPIFWSSNKGGCGCTERRELSDYWDPCQKCGGPIYLTPGAAMRRKYSGAAYQPKKQYCDSCLDEVVASGACRNAGCKSIGGGGKVEATFGDQLFYSEKQLTFPPNNCEVCRTAIKEFKTRQEVRPTCELCRRSFRVTYGVMIMILKNEDIFEVPKECLRCRGLSPDERRRLARENELDDIAKKRRGEVAKVLAGDKQELERERARLATAKEERKREFLRLLHKSSLLKRRDMRAVLEEASKEGTLLAVLSNPDKAGHRQVQEALAHVFGGRTKMTDEEFVALPGAVHSILKDHPDAMGLFQKASAHRAPGMSAVSHPYEVLSAAALKSGEFRTGSDKMLTIYSTDRVDFGIKFARGYVQPNRYGTIEADVLIHRGPLSEERTIAIDSKYTKDNQYTNIPHKQLDGIRNGLNDGKIDEFHFVTNKVFSENFKDAVRTTNLDLVRDYVTVESQYFATPAGQEELTKLGDLKTYSYPVKDFVTRYDINQIEVCEHVKYPGT